MFRRVVIQEDTRMTLKSKTVRFFETPGTTAPIHKMSHSRSMVSSTFTTSRWCSSLVATWLPVIHVGDNCLIEVRETELQKVGTYRSRHECGKKSVKTVLHSSYM